MFKHTFFISLLLAISTSAKLQIVHAIYTVNHGISVNRNDGSVQQLAQLNYIGHLYKKGERYISYDQPLFLEQYRTGVIDYDAGNGVLGTLTLCMDSLQALILVDYDSGIFRQKLDISAHDGPPKLLLYYFLPGGQTWQLDSAVRQIDGLTCQRATSRNEKTGKLYWTAWIATDIPFRAGPAGIRDVPGLVVEATSHVVNKTYKLQSYRTEAAVAPAALWPAYFNFPFEVRNQRPGS
jgi:GLPGLI family protein